ncbi:hypothetical protein [Aquimarina algiphila]|uniref:Uncharacterized protein n=1 Tax=Aquimarina algiphila TaxID=2047982 RepID=A0A554VNQ6_9FLAO|nr:hypothetical protein [Aquimarina algiphila]TSE10005.1 hypothetical protein FOF46_06805 [Aquimarina algiphila]
MENLDYNTLTKEELITLLGKRDTEITNLKDINTTQATDIAKQVATIGKLQKELFQCQNEVRIDTAVKLIDAILDLPEEEVQELPVLIRTTGDGIEAYTAFVYGSLSCLGADSGSDSEHPDSEVPLENQNM